MTSLPSTKIPNRFSDTRHKKISVRISNGMLNTGRSKFNCPKVLLLDFSQGPFRYVVLSHGPVIRIAACKITTSRTYGSKTYILQSSGCVVVGGYSGSSAVTFLKARSTSKSSSAHNTVTNSVHNKEN